jgi:hypothetical protein
MDTRLPTLIRLMKLLKHQTARPLIGCTIVIELCDMSPKKGGGRTPFRQRLPATITGATKAQISVRATSLSQPVSNRQELNWRSRGAVR